MNNYIILIAYFYVYIIANKNFSLFDMPRKINQIAIIKT